MERIIPIVKLNLRLQWYKDYNAFTDCISEINNAQIENAMDLDIVITM